MKKIQDLNCLAKNDDFAKETSSGGIFNEIKSHNINTDVLNWPGKVTCSGTLYLLDKTYSHKYIWGAIKDMKLRHIFSKDEALMLVNKAASPFLDVENREIIIYLQGNKYYLVAESFSRKDGGLIKRILLCHVKPNYQHLAGTGVIVA